MTRTRLAVPVVLLYWLVLVTGLLFYTAVRIDDVTAVLPLWTGAIAGTALGQFVALHDYRLWVAVALIGAVLTWCVPILPPELSSTDLWMAFVPATLCGFFCLSDRASLAAFWFPAVIWMLSILDRTGGQATPDGTGIVLLGALAVLFLLFLRVRESRRVGLWRTIAATPLATTRPATVLKEPPGRQLARGGWALLVSAITFSVTAWVAPHLWQTESFDAGQVQIASPEPARGLPCCPVAWDEKITRSRVTEYFDLGRGHDEITGPPRRGIDCQACEGPAVAVIGTGPIDGVIAGGAGGGGTLDGDPGPSSGSPAGWTGRDDGRPAGQVTEEPWPAPTEYAPSPTFPDRPAAAPDPVAPVTEPAPVAPVVPPVADVPAPVPPEVDPLSPTGPPGPPHDEQAPEPSPPEATAPVQRPAPESAPAAPPAQVAPRAAMPAPPPASSFQAHRPAPGAALGPQLLHWIAVIVAAALLFQLTGLALRPLRRWITLRHLRRPFWDETIDQRVSNSWQLALIGLRDAGWRATSTEAPREFARRAGALGLERCATILERTRHGVALDAGDVSEMASSADAVYRSARGSLGPFARAMAWIRWPLT